MRKCAWTSSLRAAALIAGGLAGIATAEVSAEHQPAASLRRITLSPEDVWADFRPAEEGAEGPGGGHAFPSRLTAKTREEGVSRRPAAEPERAVSSAAAELPSAELAAELDVPPAPAGSPAESAGAAAVSAGPSRDPLSLWASWNHGLELKSADKQFRVHIGGRTQFDAVWFEESDAFNGTGGIGDQDAVDFRRARLRVDATLYEFIDFAVEYDFVNSVNDNPGLQPSDESNTVNVTGLTDLWVNFSQLPGSGNLRIGQFKEPFGMEHLTSSRFLEFMERSFNQDAFAGPFNNGFSPGVMIWSPYCDECGVWASGFFKNTTNPFGFGVGDGEYAWTSRVTRLLWYEDEGARLLHVGAAGTIRDPNNGVTRYRARPSLRNGPGALNPVLVDTGTFATDSVEMFGLEAAMNLGPLNIQAEYMGSVNEDSAAPVGNPIGTVFVQGWYVESLCFLTGEHREYDRKAGVFGRVIPRENFSLHGGLGAWQVGVRYSRLDLDDDGLDGGIVQDVTIGVNWFFNPNMKLQSNYVFTHREAPPTGTSGDIHGYGMRLAFDF
jgi:phosphate-selective porin OprO/OprP